MDAPINTPSSVSYAYARQNALNQEAKKSREAEHVQQIKTALDKAAGHVSNNKPVAAYYGYLALAEDHDDPEAQCQLGLMLKEGRGVERNEVQAFFWLNKAAEQGNQRAKLELGKLYALGIGVPQNYTRAIDEFKLAAGPDGNEAVDALWQMHAGRYGLKQDNVQEKEKYERALINTKREAYCELAKMHTLGYGQEQDYQEKNNYQVALDYLNKAEIGGSETAQVEKAKLVERGLVVDGNKGLNALTERKFRRWVERGLVVDGNKGPVPLNRELARLENEYGADYVQELADYRLGAQKGDPRALYNLGMLYLEGHGVQKNLPRALEYLEKAAQRHDREAQHQLTLLLNSQTDIKLVEIVACYEAAVNNNEPWAPVGLGKLYALGLGVEKSVTGAICLFNIATELNNPYAWCELGKLYVLGYGQEADYVGFANHTEAAKACFEQAIAGGVSEASCELGKMYFHGCGVQRDFNVALTYIQAAANEGIPEALFYLGWMYLHGHCVERNLTSAVKKYREAAELGCAKAMHNLGWMYEYGAGVTQDYAAALKYYRQAEALGSPGAINNLGVMYRRGQGVEKNLKTAVEKHQAAAAMGHPVALRNLGTMYLHGLGVTQDFSAAIDCYRRAGELGDKNAWEALEAMQQAKQGDVRDYQAARAYYEKAHDTQGLPRAGNGQNNEYGDDDSGILNYYNRAAKQNDPRALYNLGMLHLEGRGVQKNLPRALDYLERAAQLHDRQAKHQLTRLLNNQCGIKSSDVVACYQTAADNNEPWALLGLGKLYAMGVQKNYAQAITLFKTAAALHNPHALYELGKLYVLGYGQEADYVGFANHTDAAKACLEQAITGGVPEAGCELGKMYCHGSGVQREFNVAFTYIQAAANEGGPEALFYLGWMYQYGHGVEKNLTSAVKKYREAAELGCAKAMHNLGWMYQHGEGVTQDEAAALQYYRQAEALGYRSAINNLGFMYERGLGVEKNLETAVEKCQAAAAMGHPVALRNLGRMYRYGLGVTQDFSAAIDCYRRAGELGDKKAWEALEAMQKAKQGDVRDYQAARAYYEKAHDTQGLPRAGNGQNNEYGDDDSGILNYYRQAATQNDPRALYNLGMLHIEGRGVQKNLPRGLEYLEQAEQLGDTEAKNKLDHWIKAELDRIAASEPDRAKAEQNVDQLLNSTTGNTSSPVFNVYIEAAKQHKTWALFGLGKLYVEGFAMRVGAAEDKIVGRDRLRGWGYLEKLVSLDGKNNDLNKADQLRITEARDLLGKVSFRNVSSAVEKSTRFPIDRDLGNPSTLDDDVL